MDEAAGGEPAVNKLYEVQPAAPSQKKKKRIRKNRAPRKRRWQYNTLQRRAVTKQKVPTASPEIEYADNPLRTIRYTPPVDETGPANLICTVDSRLDEYGVGAWYMARRPPLFKLSVPEGGADITDEQLLSDWPEEDELLVQMLMADPEFWDEDPSLGFEQRVAHAYCQLQVGQAQEVVWRTQARQMTEDLIQLFRDTHFLEERDGQNGAGE